MMRKILFNLLVILFCINVFLTGCQVLKGEDGSTQIRLNPLVAEKIEKGAEAGVQISELLAPLLGPAGGLVTGGLATFLALFKKNKKKLTEFKSREEMAHTAATISVETLEKIKEQHPKVWAEFEDYSRRLCESANLDTKEVKNFIRGLRGLPPKV